MIERPGHSLEVRDILGTLNWYCVDHWSRELGLDIVPVTVAREVDGKPGAISIWAEAAIDLPYIRDHGRWELVQGLEAQVSTARIFTALVGTRDRADGAKMLLPPERRILVADNSKGFPLNPDVEDFLVTEIEGFRFDPCALDAGLEFKLRTLKADRLTTLLGGLLSIEQIEALVAFRAEDLGEMPGLDLAEHYVAVGNGKWAAAPIAGRARIRAG